MSEPKLVEYYHYKGVEFEIMSSADPDDGTVYYYWDRHDIVGAGDCSFLPWPTIEQVKEDARREVNGENVITEAMLDEATKVLLRKMRPN